MNIESALYYVGLKQLPDMLSCQLVCYCLFLQQSKGTHFSENLIGCCDVSKAWGPAVKLQSMKRDVVGDSV